MTDQSTNLLRVPTDPNKSDFSKWKLNDKHKEIVLQKIGFYETDAEIVKHFRDEYGIKLTPLAITYYRHSQKYVTKINRYRDRFESEVVAVPLASKRKRVHELQEIYYKIKDDDRLMDAAKIINDIRIEMEGKTKEIGNVFQFNQYNNLTDDEIREKVIENAKKLVDMRKGVIDAREISVSAKVDGEGNGQV